MPTAIHTQAKPSFGPRNENRARRENIWWAALCLLLIAMLCAAFVTLWPSGSESGFQVSQAPEKWPTDSCLLHDSRLPTVVMFVESDEEGAESQIEELRDAVHTAPTKTVIVFDEAANKLRNKRLLQLANQLPNTKLVFDENQVEAQRFGAADSGDYRVYLADGSLAHADSLKGRSPEGQKKMATILAGHSRATTLPSDRGANFRVE